MKKGVMAAVSFMAGTALGTVLTGNIWKGKADKISKVSEKHLALYLMMNQWVKVKQQNGSIEEYLQKQGYKEIAIYGMNFVGETLLRELSGSDIRVRYGIDKNAANVHLDIHVVTPDDELPAVDAVIVTPITFFEEIEDMLYSKMDCPILSIDDILYEI